MSPASLLPTQHPANPTPPFSVPRPRGRDLSGPKLQAFVAELADRPELWIHFVRHDSTQRLYEELISDDHLTAWLICWTDSPRSISGWAGGKRDLLGNQSPRLARRNRRPVQTR
jgi:hypothetical protein